MKKKQSLLSGIMITAGGAIGAGMFSLPVVSSGMWFFYSLVCLFFAWLLSYLSALYILEANLHFHPGASFNTIVTKILGKNWNAAVGLAITFLLYILLYAYYSAFGNMAIESFGWEILKSNQWFQGIMSIVLGGLLAFVIWLSTAAVGRISTILVIGMVISFFVSMSGFAFQMEATKLLDQSGQNSTYFPYLWAALPYFMTSFGFASVVPSLYKFFGKNPAPIKKSILGGSLTAYFVYALFIIVAFGNISRQEFIAVNEAGGNIGHLVNAFEKGRNSSMESFMLNVLSNFAIITSFLGVGLALFDYIADKFSFTDNAKGRFKTACITFLPSGIASFFFPNGFIAAIGFAAVVIVFALFVAPFFMVRKVRSTMGESMFKVGGGNKLLFFFLVASLLVGVCQILKILGLLPQW